MHTEHGRSHRLFNQQLVYVRSPLSGRSVPLDHVPDKAFASNKMGEGIAIDPHDGILVAPFDGVVIYLIQSKHALIIEHESGLQLLIHIGINTVSLRGEGFDAHIGAGDRVRTGQPLITFDVKRLHASGYSAMTPIVVVNDDFQGQVQGLYTEVCAGQTPVMTVAL